MRDFTASQAALLSRGGVPLEMMCALLNNNVDAYGQSLEFTEHVQVGGWQRHAGERLAARESGYGKVPGSGFIQEGRRRAGKRDSAEPRP